MKPPPIEDLGFMAQQFMLVNSHHPPTLLVFCDDGLIAIDPSELANSERAALRTCGALLSKMDKQIIGVCVIAEAYTVFYDRSTAPSSEEVAPTQHPNRREALSVAYLDWFTKEEQNMVFVARRDLDGKVTDVIQSNVPNLEHNGSTLGCFSEGYRAEYIKQQARWN